MDDPNAPFARLHLSDRRVLVLGLGGGCDFITAYAVSRLLAPGSPSEVVYANTKPADVGSGERVTPHVRPVGNGTSGRVRIDRSVPRGPRDCPWIVWLQDGGEAELADEVRGLGFDLLVGVDTGGDSIASKGGRGRLGRDQRMLRVLEATGLPVIYVLVGPGCDGEASEDDLRAAMTARAEISRFHLDAILPVYRQFSAALGPTRTPNVLIAAADGKLEPAPGGRVVVPRGRRPAVPLELLTTALVYSGVGVVVSGSGVSH